MTVPTPIDIRPAFPTPETPEAYPQKGMPLRDCFAARAMQTFLIGVVLPEKEDRDKGFAMIAGVSYDMADAMMKAREV